MAISESLLRLQIRKDLWEGSWEEYKKGYSWQKKKNAGRFCP